MYSGHLAATLHRKEFYEIVISWELSGFLKSSETLKYSYKGTENSLEIVED